MRPIFFLVLFILAGCGNSSSLDLSDKKYLVSYVKDGEVVISEWNTKDSSEKTIVKYRDIESVYYIDDNLMALSYKVPRIRTVIYDKSSGREVTSINNVYLLGFLKKNNLFIGRSSSGENKALNLYNLDLSFNSKITNNSSQFDNIVLGNDKFVYSVDDDKLDRAQWWVYYLKLKKKLRLVEIENICYELVAYRSKSDQIICRTKNGLVLIGLEYKNTESINIDENFSVIYYDKDTDSLFGTSSVLKSWGEQYNLELYSFDAKSVQVVKENILITNMDEIKKSKGSDSNTATSKEISH